MSYLVLARKWRPQTFEDVVGQEHVTRTLQNSLRQDHLAHALLFSGPRGVGKTSIARILAKSMNCERGPAPVPCNECGICREITEAVSVDVLEIDGASNRGIDEIRQLRETIRFQPVRCRYRVFIIDEVHMLTKEAFNALLKTLEEPPPHVFFVFATTEPHRIPATIHSRCQHYEFRRIQIPRLADHLDRIVEAEKLGLPREATLLLAREAEGSVRDSLSLLDQVAAYGARSIEDVHEALGVLGTTVMQRLALAIVSGDVETALEVASEVYRLGVDFPKFVSDLILFFRNILILKKVGAEKGFALIELDKSEAESLLECFSGCSNNTLLNIINSLMKGESSIASSSTPRISLEILLIQLCSFGEVVAVDTLINALKNATENGRLVTAPTDMRAATRGISETFRCGDYGNSAENSKKKPTPHTTGLIQPQVVPRATGEKDRVAVSRENASVDEPELPSEPEMARSLSSNQAFTQTPPHHVADIPNPEAKGKSISESRDREGVEKPETSVGSVALDRKSWREFVAHVKSKKPPLGSVLIDARAEIDSGRKTVTLNTSSTIHRDMLLDTEWVETLKEMLLNFFGLPIKIAVIKESRAGSEKASSETHDKRQQLLGTPLVQEAMKVFGAKISGVQLAKAGGRKR